VTALPPIAAFEAPSNEAMTGCRGRCTALSFLRRLVSAGAALSPLRSGAGSISSQSRRRLS